MGGWNKITHKDTAAFSSSKQSELGEGPVGLEVEGNLWPSRSSCLESYFFTALCQQGGIGNSCYSL